MIDKLWLKPTSEHTDCEECAGHGHGWAHARLFVLVDQDTTLAVLAKKIVKSVPG